MTTYRNFAFRVLTTALALSLAACAHIDPTAPGSGPTWRNIGPPAKSIRVRVQQRSSAGADAAEQRSNATR